MNRTWLARLLLGIILVCAFPTPTPAEATAGIQFSSRFVNPPANARIIKIIHGWPDEPGQQDDLIRSLAGEGFGGVVCNVSFTDYLESATKWKAFVRAVQKAKETGFSMWLYDEKGYPSVAAGGLVLKDHPEWEARGLLIAEKRIAPGPVTLELPPGRPVLTAAFPVRQGKLVLAKPEQLSGMIQDRKLSWQAPTGQWQILLVTEDRLHDGTHAAMSLAEHLPYPNLLMREPTAKFLEVTHDRYAQHLGTNLGQYFVSTFTDEPSLMSLFLRRMPYRVLPWSPDFAAEFKRRRGYAVEPLLPALVVDAGPDSAKVRYDFWKTVGELVSKNYFGQIQDWCHAHNVLSGGHLLMEENLANHVPLYGDFFQCLRRLDAPSIDCLTSIPEQVPWFIAQLANSAAELENKSVVMCETSDHSQRYRPAGDARPVRTVSESEIRGTCNRLIRAGVNVITSYYSFAGLSKEELRRLNEWVGRCCAAVSGGHQVAEIGVVYPVESVWTRFTPSRIYANESAGAVQIEQVFRNVSDALYAAGRDFTYVDSRALCESRVEDGALVHGKLRWRILVLPAVDTLPLKAWENLDRFVSEGGLLIAVGSLPKNSETDFPSSQVQALAQKIFQEPGKELKASAHSKQRTGIYLPAGWTAGLGVLLNRVLPSEVTLNTPAGQYVSALKFTHRRIDGREIFFLINDGVSSWRGDLTLAVEGAGEQWDPATGSSQALATGDKIPIELPGYGAAIFAFAKTKPARPLKLDNSSMPQLKTRELPPVTPEIARGEFVREKMERLESAGKPAWRITGAITKGQVDTYLFARFLYKEPLDLRQIDALVFDTVVPEGQRMPGQLLVILHEKRGADYLANTGRILGSPGLDQCWLSPGNFQLAGWSTDTNAHLDLSEITEIRVGWGGYLGEEGETVEFTVSPPAIAVLPKD